MVFRVGEAVRRAPVQQRGARAALRANEDIIITIIMIMIIVMIIVTDNRTANNDN